MATPQAPADGATMLDTQTVADSAGPMVTAYRAVRTSLPGADHAWVRSFRDRAMALFAQAGVPTRRDEAWKYTDLRSLAKLTPRVPLGVPAVPPGLDAALALADESVHAMVFVNGWFRPELSFLNTLPDGVEVTDLATALAKDAPALAAVLNAVDLRQADPMEAASAAFLADGCSVYLRPGAVLDKPLRVVHLLTGAADDPPLLVAPRLLITAEAQSEITVIEHWAGEVASIALPARDITVADGARVRHYLRQDEGARAVHLGRTRVLMHRDAGFAAFALTGAGALVRNECRVHAAGPGADVQVGGVYLGSGRRHIDTTTLVQHAAPDGRSRQVFKGILDDASRGVFQGRVGVSREAQRTDGHQLSNALLLSPKAEMDAKPELEIFADDVKCSHGATTGDLDPDALFYLRTRGIDAAVARGLLVEAFIAEAIEEIASEPVRAEFAEAARAWWHAHTAGRTATGDTGGATESKE